MAVAIFFIKLLQFHLQPVHLLFRKIFRILKKLLDISKISVIMLTVPCDTEDLCNGSTPDSDSVCGGSNPSSSARKRLYSKE